jgi:hypothetical protein
MKHNNQKYVFLILIIGLSKIAKAQNGLFISPQVSFANTQLFNKEDKAGFTFKEGQKNFLPMVTTYSPCYGGIIGLARNNNGVGLYAVYSGVSYQSFKQKYKGSFGLGIDPDGATSTTTLNFVQIPLIAEVSFGSGDRTITPIAGIGLQYASLRSYSDVYHADVKDTSGNLIFMIDQTIKNDYYSNAYSGLDIQSAKFDTWYFKKNILNSYLCIGAKIRLGNRIDVLLKCFNTMSLTQAETTDKKNYYFAGNAGLIYEQFNPYDMFVNKVLARGEDREKRPPSKLIQTGLSLNVNFKLYNNENY